MADGALNVPMTEDTAHRLAERALAVGLTPEVLAGQMLIRLLDDTGGENRPSRRPQDYEGPYVELEDALTAFGIEVERHLGARAE